GICERRLCRCDRHNFRGERAIGPHRHRRRAYPADWRDFTCCPVSLEGEQPAVDGGGGGGRSHRLPVAASVEVLGAVMKLSVLALAAYVATAILTATARGSDAPLLLAVKIPL